MSRNDEMHFSENPTSIDIPRSKFNIPFDHKTSMVAGELTPIYCAEVLPGDTTKIDLASLVRMSTPIYPVMDNAYLDTYFFYVPNRLVWEHWKEFMGENTTSYWTPDVEYTIPQTKAPTGGWAKGSLADHMGLPIGVENISVDSLPFRAFALIYNEWFRSENLIEPLDITRGDATTEGSNGTDPVVDVQKGGMLPKVGRLADYFSAALPSPQKGPDIYIPLGATAPVMGNGLNLGLTDGNRDLSLSYLANGENFVPSSNMGQPTGSTRVGGSGNVFATGKTIGITKDGEKSGLVADLRMADGATISQLRQSFAIQRMYEKDARGGRAIA